MHQFDNYEARNVPWAPCDPWGHFPKCQGEQMAGRISCTLVYRGMHGRKDRVALPLTSTRGGIIVRSNIEPHCVYGDDGSTWNAPGGCWPRWCDPKDPWAGGQSGHRCGFGGRDEVRAAWHPKDLKTMLELFQDHSQPYKSPQFYSGYNELVYSSEQWNHQLPHAIEAFFLLHGHDDQAARNAHQEFLAMYHVSAKDVPLLTLDPSNWWEPFL